MWTTIYLIGFVGIWVWVWYDSRPKKCIVCGARAGIQSDHFCDEHVARVHRGA